MMIIVDDSRGFVWLLEPCTIDKYGITDSTLENEKKIKYKFFMNLVQIKYWHLLLHAQKNQLVSLHTYRKWMLFI